MMWIQNKKSLLLKSLLMLGFIVPMQGCFNQTEAPAPVPRLPVEVEPLKQEALDITHTFMGEVENRAAIEIKPRIQGYIEKIYVEAGDTVQKGQLLLSLDAHKQESILKSLQAQTQSSQAQVQTATLQLKAYREELKEAQAKFKLASDTFKRIDNLHQQQSVSSQQWEEVKTQKDVEASRLAGVQRKLQVQEGVIRQAQARKAETLSQEATQKEDVAYAKIVAPFAGTVGYMPFKVGEFVLNLDVLTTLSDTSKPLNVLFEAPVESLGYLKKGQTVILQNQEGVLTHQGQVNYVASQMDKNTQAIMAKASITPVRAKETPLISGQRLSIGVRESTGKQTVLPLQAVTFIGTQAFVYTTFKHKEQGLVAKRVPVSLGALVNNRYVLKGSSLRLGDGIIVGGIQMLQDGVPIELAKKQAFVNNPKEDAHAE
jgi:RND family efflux transporter MFP subunit